MNAKKSEKENNNIYNTNSNEILTNLNLKKSASFKSMASNTTSFTQ